MAAGRSTMVRRTAPAVGLALFLAACSSTAPVAAPTTLPAATSVPATTVPSTTTTAPAPTTTTSTLPAGVVQRAVAVTGPPVSLRYDDGVPPQVLAVVDETIPIAREALGESGPLVVHVYASADNLVAAHDARSQERARADVDAGLVASAAGGVIWIYAPRFAERQAMTRRQIVLHEYFHTVQVRLSSGRSGATPLWLREGTARYVEFGVAGDYGYTDYSRLRANEIRVSRRLAALNDYEERPGAGGDSGDAYALGFLAAEYLESLKGRDAVQRGFWATLRTSTDWRAAFATVFGLSIDQFYVDFEAYRQTL